MAQMLIDKDIVPDLTVGVSMGAFAAAAISGNLTFEDALVAVINQAQTLEAQCSNGGMIAILHSPTLYAEPALRDNCEIASISFSGHFVVSARKDSLDNIQAFLRQKQIVFQRLPVSFAFHSKWIYAAEEQYQCRLNSLKVDAAAIPMLCCVNAEIISTFPSNYLWTAVRQPIKFQEAIAHLEKKGACQYIDVGPSGTLASLIKYVLPSGSRSKAFSTLSPYGRDLENIAALPANLASHIEPGMR